MCTTVASIHPLSLDTPNCGFVFGMPSLVSVYRLRLHWAAICAGASI